MTQQDDVIRMDDPSGAYLIIDNRYFPILVHSWNGPPTMELARSYFELRRPAFVRAHKERTKCIVISDLSKTGSPPATVRKYLGDTGKLEDNVDEFLGYMICVPSAIMRGVVTALKWIIGDDLKPSVMVSSIDEAFEKASKTLENHGVNVPLMKYTPPD